MERMRVRVRLRLRLRDGFGIWLRIRLRVRLRIRLRLRVAAGIRFMEGVRVSVRVRLRLTVTLMVRAGMNTCVLVPLTSCTFHLQCTLPEHRLLPANMPRRPSMVHTHGPLELTCLRVTVCLSQCSFYVAVRCVCRSVVFIAACVRFSQRCEYGCHRTVRKFVVCW